MSVDIIERLTIESYTNNLPVLSAAIDEILRLRGELEDARSQRDETARHYDQIWKELAGK